MRNNVAVLQPTHRATLEDVAAAAGVSASTASRALSFRGDLSSSTRERVIAAAATLGYDRSTTARGRAAAPRGHLVELVLGAFDSSWSDRVVAGARREAFALGYDVVLTPERDDPADDWPTRVAERRSAGVVLALITPTRAQLQVFAAFGVPTVLLDPRSDPAGDLVSVGATNERGGADAATHLVACGYESFAIATSGLRYRFGRARERGFREALERLRPGAAVETIDAEWDGSVPPAALAPAFARARHDRLGVFAVNDAIARTICAAAGAFGLHVPGDVGVVGFDDAEEPRGSIPLTTIRQPLEEMAAAAVRSLNESHRLGGAPRSMELPTQLVVRASTASP